MRVHRWRRLALVAAAAGLLLGTGAAHAANAEHVEWTLSNGYYNCTTGTSNGWTCTYDLFSYGSNCTEAAAVGTPLANCDLSVHAVVNIVPVVNAAGRLVGCTSGGSVLLGGSSADYDSAFDEFDDPDIESIFIGQVYDAFADGNPGALSVTAIDESQSSDPAGAEWIVTGAAAISCMRSSSGWASTGSGTVDVEE